MTNTNTNFMKSIIKSAKLNYLSNIIKEVDSLEYSMYGRKGIELLNYPGLTISSSKIMQMAQENFSILDRMKNFDYSTFLYWISYNGDPVGFNTIEELNALISN